MERRDTPDTAEHRALVGTQDIQGLQESVDIVGIRAPLAFLATVAILVFQGSLVTADTVASLECQVTPVTQEPPESRGTAAIPELVVCLAIPDIRGTAAIPELVVTAVTAVSVALADTQVLELRDTVVTVALAVSLATLGIQASPE